MMSRPEAEAITALVTAIRPTWDPDGILSALYKCRDKPLADVARAAIAAAVDVTNRTPGVIPLMGPHWAMAGEKVTQHPPRPNERCRTHLGWGANCPGCRADELAGDRK